jgi:hypothetical protein
MCVSILVCMGMEMGMGIDLEEGRFVLRVGRGKEVARHCYIRKQLNLSIHGQEIKSSQDFPMMPDRCFHNS